MGFKETPENINRKGAPKKECSLTNLAKEYLEQIPDGKGKSRKQLFIENVCRLAMSGDVPCIKLMWNYLDGMPKQNISIEGEVPVSPLAEAIKESREEYAKNNTNSTVGDVKSETK